MLMIHVSIPHSETSASRAASEASVSVLMQVEKWLTQVMIHFTCTGQRKRCCTQWRTHNEGCTPFRRFDVVETGAIAKYHVCSHFSNWIRKLSALLCVVYLFMKFFKILSRDSSASVKLKYLYSETSQIQGRLVCDNGWFISLHQGSSTFYRPWATLLWSRGPQSYIACLFVIYLTTLFSVSAYAASISTQSWFVCHLAAKQVKRGWETWPLNFADEYLSCS
jgi:hypothetical protein